MAALGVELVSVEPGRVEMTMPMNATYAQQHGFLHAGILSTIMDSACGYAAHSLMEEHAEVLTVEFKTSLLAPADGERFEVEAQVIKSGRTLTFVEATAMAVKDGERKKIASMSGTMMSIVNRAGINT